VSVYPTSAEREVIFVDLLIGAPNSEASLAALTREYWQMVQFNLDANEPLWAEAGQSLLLLDMAGYPEPETVDAFSSLSNTRLNTWPGPAASDQSLIASAGASYLYHLYVAERAGAFLREETGAGSGDVGVEGLEAMTSVTGSPLNGLAAIDEAADTLGMGVNADDLFFDWTVANLLDDSAVGDGRFGFGRAEVGNLCPVTALDVIPVVDSVSIMPYSAHYYEMLEGSQLKTLEFAGQPTSPMRVTDAFSGGVAWWSGQGNWIETSLTRTLDLSTVGSATLEFALWYDIAPGQDAAFLMVSTDGGETWDAIEAPHSTQAYGLPAFVGRSGGGDQATWVLERIDLSSYAGQEIMLSFAYVTGGGETGNGVLVDDIKVGDIGYFDGVEGLDEGWEAEGWLRTSNEIPNNWKLYLVTETIDQRNRPVHAVTPFEVNADGTANVSQPLPNGVSRSWLVVALAARYTDTPSEYLINLDGDFTLAPQPEIPAGGLAAENFESSCGLFAPIVEDDFSDAIANGALTMEVNKSQTTHGTLAEGVYDDVVVSVDSTLPPFPAGNSSWGVICRYVDDLNFFGFEVRADGSHRIFSVENGVETDLSPFEESEVIDLSPAAVNNMVVACVEETVSLTVNGEVVAFAEEVGLSTGQVGLILSSDVITPARISFDNFLVTGPTGAELTALEPTPTPAPDICDCSGNIYDCRDFSNRGEAQRCYDFCGGRANDIHLLDADGNGVVCETVFP
jgi:hypothetical protein